MASRKTNEQCITWLKSMAADRNSLDGINAELCLNVINEQREKLDKLGVQFHQVKEQLERLKEKAACEEEWPTMIDFSRLTDAQKDILRENGIEIGEF